MSANGDAGEIAVQFENGTTGFELWPVGEVNRDVVGLSMKQFPDLANVGLLATLQFFCPGEVSD